MLDHGPQRVLYRLPRFGRRLQPPANHRDADVVELVAVLCEAGVDHAVVVHPVSRVVRIELRIARDLLRVDTRVGALLPVSRRRRLAVTAHGADDLVYLPLEIDMHAHGIGDAPIVIGDVFPLGEFLFHFIVFREIFHDRHLGRLLRLNEAVVVAPCKLRESLRRDDTQIVVVIEKTSVHILVDLLVSV